MTTLYKPVQIETAEQAEALPDDAIVIGVETGERYTRGFEGDWWGVTEMGTRLGVDLDLGELVTALVPIEAEEETVRSLRLDGRMDGSTFEEGDELPEHFYDGPPRTRYVTPWEEA